MGAELEVDGAQSINQNKSAALTKSVSPSTDGVPSKPPAERPPFTVEQVKNAIPKHCFQRSVLRSFSYVAIDLTIVALLGYASSFIPSLPLWARVLAWPAYWLSIGTVMTGVWVLAHECGHQAFSKYQVVNDSVGVVLHSALLVPYWSWKYSHKNHHAQTCSVEHDEVFVPSTRSDYKTDMINDSPLANAWGIFVMLTFGWPFYLISNASGPAKHRDQAHNSHFHPESSLFRDRERLWVAMSDVGFFAAIATIAYCCTVFGVSNVFFYYFVPYLVVNAYLVLITYLQHSDVYVPHYREKEFTWLRGALSTVDRSFSWLHDIALHHITDTHVAHHMFHEIPFYHGQEATEAIKKVLGPYYLHDPTPVHKALWRSFKECKFVEDDEDVCYYKNAAQFAEGAKKKQ